MQTKRQRELDEVRQKQDNLADHQHHYATKKLEASKPRAEELEQSEEKREKDEEVLLAMEKEVGERCRANALNQDNPKEVEDELRKIEEKIDAESEESLE